MSPDALIEALSGSIITQPDGVVIYLNAAGKPHRTAGPAVVYPDGSLLWYRNNRLHREDGAAIIHPDGEERWYQNGKRHRIDGPAIVYPNGEQHWYQQGLLHRTDGPAIVYSDGHQRWYLNGEEFSEEEFNQCIADGGYNDARCAN